MWYNCTRCDRIVTIIGMWLSLVEHYVRDVGAAGSNPVIPTKIHFGGTLRGVAQLVARTSGGRGAAGSSPVTPTKIDITSKK